jgi:adenosylcobinamide-GDP ribazoletransferase
MISRDDACRRLNEAIAALTFFTRLPVHCRPGPALAAAAWTFPVAGAVVGALAAAGFALAWLLGLPPLAAALLAVGTGITATGALHEDGLADAVDALGAGGSRGRRLAVMRDSRIGTFGALAVVLSVGLRAAALDGLGPWVAAAALVAAHAGSRALLPLAMTLMPAARADGLGAGAGRPDGPALGWSLGLGAAAVLLALGPGAGLTAAALAVVAVLAAARLARRAVGGYTGDVLGAIQQTAEIVILLTAAALP